MPLAVQAGVAAHVVERGPAALRIPDDDRQCANRENQQRQPRAGFSQMNPRRRRKREENCPADELQTGGVFAEKAESHRQADDEPVARFAVRLRSAPAGDHRPRPAENQRRIHRHQNCAEAEQRRGGGNEQQPERRARADFPRQKPQSIRLVMAAKSGEKNRTPNSVLPKTEVLASWTNAIAGGLL